MLSHRDLLERDVFARPPMRDDTEIEGEVLYDISLGDLLDALQDVRNAQLLKWSIR